MKKSEIILAILISIIPSTIVFAAFKLDKVTFDLKNHVITENYVGGQMTSVNTIATNGDTIQTNQFVSDGSSYMPTYRDPDETTIIGGLISRQSINVDDVTNSTMGQTNLVLGGYDKTVVDLNAAQ